MVIRGLVESQNAVNYGDADVQSLLLELHKPVMNGDNPVNHSGPLPVVNGVCSKVRQRERLVFQASHKVNLLVWHTFLIEQHLQNGDLVVLDMGGRCL